MRSSFVKALIVQHLFFTTAATVNQNNTAVLAEMTYNSYKTRTDTVNTMSQTDDGRFHLPTHNTTLYF